MNTKLLIIGILLVLATVGIVHYYFPNDSGGIKITIPEFQKIYFQNGTIILGEKVNGEIITKEVKE